MEDKCEVTLEVYTKDGVDAAEITRRLGTEPTEVVHEKYCPQAWTLRLTGGSPVNAGRLANDLLHGVLDRVRPAQWTSETWALLHSVELGLNFEYGELLNFSYELDAEAIRGVAALRASIQFSHYVHGENDKWREFVSRGHEDEGCEASFRIIGPDFEPDDATSSLGLEPSRIVKRPDRSRVWLFEGTSPRTATPDEHIVALLARLPTRSEAWRRLCREQRAEVMLSFVVPHLTGFFDIDRSTFALLAECGLGLDASMYDWGPSGLDLLP